MNPSMHALHVPYSVVVVCLASNFKRIRLNKITISELDETFKGMYRYNREKGILDHYFS